MHSVTFSGALYLWFDVHEQYMQRLVGRQAASSVLENAALPIL